MQGSIGLNVCDERFLQLNDQPTRAAVNLVASFHIFAKSSLKRHLTF